ncbi:MAG TPA: hypothetical protein VKA34_18240 [Balneolales bacterium]|nr:hypothetical protein [Balneolales bacterium]
MLFDFNMFVFHSDFEALIRFYGYLIGVGHDVGDILVLLIRAFALT